MFNKLIAFLGLTELMFKNGKATIELSEEEAKASNAKIEELEKATNEELEKVQGQLAEETTARETAESELASSIEMNHRLESDLSTANARIAELETQVEELGKKPGASTSPAITDTDEEPKGDAQVTKDGGDFVANMFAVADAYL